MDNLQPTTSLCSKYWHKLQPTQLNGIQLSELVKMSNKHKEVIPVETLYAVNNEEYARLFLPRILLDATIHRRIGRYDELRSYIARRQLQTMQKVIDAMAIESRSALPGVNRVVNCSKNCHNCSKCWKVSATTSGRM